MSLSRISPVLGSCTCGPEAFCTCDGSQRITEYRTSSGLNSGSSSKEGGIRPWIALLKPAASKASCQSSIPWMRYGRHFSGVAGSR